MDPGTDIQAGLDQPNACESIFTKVREEIVSGALKPGQKLKQTELARRFGISRTPVRDALKKLEAEGLVMAAAGRCAIVPVLDMEEFQEVYRIRAVLEELAVGLALPRMNEADRTALGELVKAMEKASRAGDLAVWLQLDYKFHERLYAPCRSPRLLKLIVSFWNSTHHFRRAYCTLPGRIRKAELMHRRMLTAVAGRDEELARVLTRYHIEESIREIIRGQPRGSATGMGG